VSNSLGEADAKWRGEHLDTVRLVTGDVAASIQAPKDEPGDGSRFGEAANRSRRYCSSNPSIASA